MIFWRPNFSVGSFALHVGYKTQMGTTFWSSSHFVAFELLRLRRQITVIMAGCIFIRFLLTHSVDYFQPVAFGNCLLQQNLRAVRSVYLAVNLGGRSVKRIRQNSSLSIRIFAVRNRQALRLSRSPEKSENCVSFFPVFNPTF